MKHDALVASLTKVLERLAARDSAGTTELMDALVDQLHSTPSPTADPRVMQLYEACVAAANTLATELEHELKAQARGARASTAYGVDQP